MSFHARHGVRWEGKLPENFFSFWSLAQISRPQPHIFSKKSFFFDLEIVSGSLETLFSDPKRILEITIDFLGFGPRPPMVPFFGPTAGGFLEKIAFLKEGDTGASKRVRRGAEWQQRVSRGMGGA